ncbi:hypothetical protein [Streptomyces lutosisoli]|uniref:Uncharacterized protein n=1 Tax=Streptomyces lutosisoli TaxID=2665721 RepID=A0ABW2VMZ3_9ACTN
MTDPTRYATPPVELPLRLDAEPLPVPGCDVCSALDQERSEARGKGDMSKVSDINVEIRSHPHEGRHS